MTTQLQKQTEERYARMLLDGLIDHTTIEHGQEPPDFWVRRSGAPDIALEITEYHPEAHGVPGIRRKEVESRWWKELEPILEEKQTRSW